MTTPAIGTITLPSNRMMERMLAAIPTLFPGIESCVARILPDGAGLGQRKDRQPTALRA